MKPLYLLGDSHAAPICRALRIRKQKGQTTALRGGMIGAATRFYLDFFELRDNKIEFREPSLETHYTTWKERAGVRDLGECSGSLVLSLGLASAPFYGDDMWRMFSPENHASRQFISSSLIDRIIADLQHHVLRFLALCHERDLLVALVSAAPPQGRHPAIKHLGATTLASLHTRFQTPVRKWAAERSIPIIEPACTMDDRGFLLEQFWGDDPAHGNPGYGEVFLKELEQISRQ